MYGGTGMCIPMFDDYIHTLQNRQIFPNYSSARRPLAENSALARIRQRRVALRGMVHAYPADVPEPRPLAQVNQLHHVVDRD
jgi:hypothetical protein